MYASYINRLTEDGPVADGREEPAGLALDILGNIYVTGETHSSGFPVTGNAYDGSFTTSNQRDCFIFKLYPGTSSASMLLYSSFFGGDQHVPSGLTETGNRGRSLEFISKGTYRNKLLVGGATTTSDFPTTSGVVFGSWFSGDLVQGWVSVHDPN